MEPLSSDSALEMESGHIIYNTISGPGIEDIHFVRVSPGSPGTPQEKRVIRGIPSVAYAIYPPSNLLAVLRVADEGRSV